LVGSPLKLSDTPVSYRLPPPSMGAQTDEVLESLLNLAPAELADLKAKKVI
jgi:crotonobetainyl-CoA:carnitine CoA-transferase CaiB-like acyl-CoA transferase